MNSPVQILINVFIYTGLFRSVYMHYMFAENPNIGYVSLNKGLESYPVGYSLKPRRYMGLTGNQKTSKTNEEKVNDYSKKVKQQRQQESFDKINSAYKLNQRSTELPRSQKKDDTDYLQDQRKARALKSKNLNTNISPQNGYSNSENLHDQQMNKANPHDNKANILQVNVRKIQIAAEPQKVRINNNRQLSALSVQGRDDFKRIPSSVLVDKTLQKGANFKERNVKMMARILDDMSQKFPDRRMKVSEYSKRDTNNSNEKTRRNNVSDKMRKYIGKDLNMLNEHAMKASRIGNHKEEFEDNNNKPYALFYRMTPDSLENQDGIYITKKMEDDTDITFTTKDKRQSVNYQNEEVDLKPAKSKKNMNTNLIMKMSNRMKNISNYQNK